MSYNGSMENSSIEIILTVGIEAPAAWTGNQLVSVFCEIGGEAVMIPFSIKSWTLCLRAQ